MMWLSKIWPGKKASIPLALVQEADHVASIFSQFCELPADRNHRRYRLSRSTHKEDDPVFPGITVMMSCQTLEQRADKSWAQKNHAFNEAAHAAFAGDTLVIEMSARNNIILYDCTMMVGSKNTALKTESWKDTASLISQFVAETSPESVKLLAQTNTYTLPADKNGTSSYKMF